MSEKKVVTVLHSCGGERGGNQPGDKDGERVPPALHQRSLARGKLQLNAPQSFVMELILQGTELP